MFGSVLGARHFNETIWANPFYLVMIMLGFVNLIGVLAMLAIDKKRA